MQHKSLAAGLLAAFAASTKAEGDSHVTQLTNGTFGDFIKGNDLVLADFSSPFCRPCKALDPEYEEAAISLKGKNIKLAKIDCYTEFALCKEYDVGEHPTLKVFRGPDNFSPYTGQHKASTITSYMVKQSLPIVSDLNKDTLEEFKTIDEVVIIAYTDDSDSASNDIFGEVANSLSDTYVFGSVKEATVTAAEGITTPAILLYKAFDEGITTFTGRFEEEAIKAFAKAASTPLFGEIGPETYASYLSAGLPIAHIFAETPKQREELSGRIRSIARKYQGKINFGIVDAKLFGAHAGNLNLKTDKFPAFAIQDPIKNQMFPFDQDSEITTEAIAKFTEEFLAGKTEPSSKSEPIPQTQEEGSKSGKSGLVEMASSTSRTMVARLKSLMAEYLGITPGTLIIQP